MGPSLRRLRRGVGVLAVSLGAVGDGGCGARSELSLPEPCGDAGARRGCENVCGAGEEVCELGYWQPCVVPVATRPCTNTCGAGSQQCVDDAWLACAVPTTTRSCASVCGSGTQVCADDTLQACNAPLPGPPTIPTTLRNIRVGEPDFLTSCCTGGNDPGIVATSLGSDDTPTYVGNPTTGTLTTHGAASFQPWFHDVPGTNLSTPFALALTPDSTQQGLNTFDNEAFFPIDGQLFGNQGGAHNYNITVEAHAKVLYVGGETYGFSSDDDLWVFINRHLVVDLGGLHSGMSMPVALDDIASAAGLSVGEMFPIDFFYANREPPGAVLMVSIPQSDLWSCP